jgi:phosphoglycerate dehydrogenase-like enzyme
MMKSDAILINISRGFANRGRSDFCPNHNMIGGAVLDVFKMNLTLIHVFIARNLYILLIAGYTKESDVEMSLDVVKNYLNYINNN